MAKFPEPPAPPALAAIGPVYHRLPRGFELWRIYFRGGANPARWGEFRRFGPVAQARFDHHLPPPHLQQRGILYAAASGLTALAEVFQRRRTIDVLSGRPWLVGFAAAEALTLLDLTGLWPTVAGASMALSSGSRPWARRWSQAIYTAFPEGRGLWYPSSMAGNAPALALFERAELTLPAQPFFHRPLDDPALRNPLRRAARRLGYRLISAT